VVELPEPDREPRALRIAGVGEVYHRFDPSSGCRS
jgi:hypothetical protein